MTTLHEFLAPTMLRTADADAKLVRAKGKPPTVKARKLSAKKKPQWSFKLKFVKDRPRVSELKCMVPAHGHAMPVCDRIRWHDVQVMVRGTKYLLPLSESYLLGSYQSKLGRIKANSTHAFWQLDAVTDRSVQLVFGFELRGGGAIEPLDPALVDAADFSERFLDPPPEPVPEDDQECIENAWGGDPSLECGEEADVYVDSGRVLVCLSLVCCRARYDFDPGELVRACRFYPLVMVASNVPLLYTYVDITIQRPAEAMAMDDSMTSELAVGLFADRNSDDMGLTDMPEWQLLFDYYDVAPPAGLDFVAVRRNAADAKKRTDEKNRAVRSLDYDFELDLDIEKITVETRNTVVKKVPYQGEFDNIHIAPYMLRDGEKVVMAPICQHDCMHVHWRWGKPFDNKTARGWSRDGRPYAEAGAPLVPPNQSVRVTLTTDKPGFIYNAMIRDTDPGELQVVMHHGAAYGTGLKDAFATDVLEFLMSSWPDFYYFLRYDVALYDPDEEEDFGTVEPAVAAVGYGEVKPWRGGNVVEKLYFRDLQALRRLGE